MTDETQETPNRLPEAREQWKRSWESRGLSVKLAQEVAFDAGWDAGWDAAVRAAAPPLVVPAGALAELPARIPPGRIEPSGPTQDAYDAACKALWRHRAENERLRAAIQRIESGVVPGEIGYYVPNAEWDDLVKLAAQPVAAAPAAQPPLMADTLHTLRTVALIPTTGPVCAVGVRPPDARRILAALAQPEEPDQP